MFSIKFLNLKAAQEQQPREPTKKQEPKKQKALVLFFALMHRQNINDSRIKKKYICREQIRRTAGWNE